MSRLIDADVFRKRIDRYPPEIRDAVKKELRYTPTIEPDWNEMLVICDNCGHAIHVKRLQGESGGT